MKRFFKDDQNSLRLKRMNVFKKIPNVLVRAWGLAARLNKINVRGRKSRKK